MKLKEVFKEVLSAEELQLMVGSYDVVGDIAIMIIPKELEHKQKILAELLLTQNRNIKVVTKRDGVYEGEFRTIALSHLAGEQRKETMVTEFGVRLMVNPEEVYYSVRSGGERRRVAEQVQRGERVLVLFSGIGPYPLLISKYSKAARIDGVEKNPKAHAYAMANLKCNKKLKNIHFYNEDAAKFLHQCQCNSTQFDRVTMPLPKTGSRFLEDVFKVIKSGGVLHYYEIAKEEEFSKAVKTVEAVAQETNRKIESTEVIKCGHCAPRTYRICIDCTVT